MSIYLPVRECRRVWHERYSEQLCLDATDVAPWLIELAEVSDPMGGRDYTPQLRPGLRQPHNTTGDSRSILGGTRGCLRLEEV